MFFIPHPVYLLHPLVLWWGLFLPKSTLETSGSPTEHAVNKGVANGKVVLLSAKKEKTA